MGLGDFLGGAAEAVGHAVADTATGLYHGVETVATHLDDAARVGSWVANPHHWDDIAEGAGKAAQYVGEHPGQVWDTGFEVGRYIVKDQLLDPKNLALNAAMLGVTVATGGGAGGALVARGLTAMRGVRGAEEALEASRVVEGGISAARGLEGAVDVARGAEGAADVAQTGSRLSRGLDRVDNFLSAGPERRAAMRGRLSSATHGLINPEGTMGFRARQGIGGAIEGDAPGAVRSMLGQAVRQSSFKPEATGSAVGDFVATNAWRARRLEAMHGTVQTVEHTGAAGEGLFQAVTNPVGFGISKAKDFGYDPEALGRQALAKAEGKAAKKVLEDGSKGGKKRRPLDQPDQPAMYQPTTTLEQQPSSSYTRSTGGAVATSAPEQYEKTETGPITLGRGRSSSFYQGASNTYAPAMPTGETKTPQRRSFAYA